MGFKEHLKEKGVFTDEEEKVCDMLCDTMNSNKELKAYFADFVTGLLRAFLTEMKEAYKKGDKKLAQKAANKAGDKIRAITTYLYIKVSMKKEVN